MCWEQVATQATHRGMFCSMITLPSSQLIRFCNCCIVIMQQTGKALELIAPNGWARQFGLIPGTIFEKRSLHTVDVPCSPSGISRLGQEQLLHECFAFAKSTPTQQLLHRLTINDSRGTVV